MKQSALAHHSLVFNLNVKICQTTIGLQLSNLFFLTQAILDRATTHTKNLLQKSEERVKALEKVRIVFTHCLTCSHDKKASDLISSSFVSYCFPSGGQQSAVGSELQSGTDEEIPAVVGAEIQQVACTQLQ